MKFLALLLLHSLNALAVIYGNDDRLDLYQINNPFYHQLASSSVAIIENSNLNFRKDGWVHLKSKSYQSENNLCTSEKFSNQHIVSYCSGVLISPDVVLTAGHCFETQNDCYRFKFAFGYSYSKVHEYPQYIHQSEVYSCTKVLRRRNDEFPGLDLALVQLDRVVSNHEPARYASESHLSRGDMLISIGYPQGLPMKIANNGFVRSVSNNYFNTTLDVYYSNSGSPIFNVKTGFLEGILIQGEEEDFIKARGHECFVSKVCNPWECDGEDVLKISAILPTYQEFISNK